MAHITIEYVILIPVLFAQIIVFPFAANMMATSWTNSQREAQLQNAADYLASTIQQLYLFINQEEISVHTSASTGGELSRDGADQGQDSSATVTFSHTLGYPSGNDRVVVVAAGFEHSSGDINIGSATYNGQSMTKIVQATTGGGGYAASVAIFYILDSSLPANPGDYTVVVTADSNPSRDLWACAVSYMGVKQEAQNDYDSDSAGSSTTMTSNLNCGEDGSMLVQACVVGATGSYSPSSGTTEVIEDSNIYSASAVFNEKLDQNSGSRNLGCTHDGMNRGAWVGACWAPAPREPAARGYITQASTLPQTIQSYPYTATGALRTADSSKVLTLLLEMEGTKTTATATVVLGSNVLWNEESEFQSTSADASIKVQKFANGTLLFSFES